MNLFSKSYRETLRNLTAYYSRSGGRLLLVQTKKNTGTAKQSNQNVELEYVAGMDPNANSFPYSARDASLRFGDEVDLVLNDVIAYVDDVWQLLRDLNSQLAAGSRLFIVHPNYLWSPLINLWRRLFPSKNPTRSWFSTIDIDNLLRINGFEIVSTDHALLLPIWIPGLNWLFNSLLVKLPLLKHLGLVQLYVVKKNPRFKPLQADQVPYKVSLIIPTKDERGNMAPCFAAMPKLGRETELVFVDGASKDGTYEEIEKLAPQYANRFKIQLLRQKKLDGKGSAVRQGFEAATGDILFVFDSDLTVRCEDLPKFILALAEGEADFVMGSRLVYPMEDQAMRTLNNIANKAFSLIFSWLLNRPIKDTLCGTKGTFRSHYDWIKAGRAYFGDFDPFGDFDLIFGAARNNLKIVEIPIRYLNRTYGEIKISRFTHGWLLLKMTWLAARKIKFR